MAEKFNLDEFYKKSLFSDENIIELNTRSLEVRGGGVDKDYKIMTTNLAFGMLAHLCVLSDEYLLAMQINMIFLDYWTAEEVKFVISIFNRLGIIKDEKLNPKAIPTIERYRNTFESYEKQHDIKNPYSDRERYNDITEIMSYYDASKITLGSLTKLNFLKNKVFYGQTEFIKPALTLALTMLAQLNVIENKDTPYIGSRLHLSGIVSGNYQIMFLEDLKELQIYDHYKLNHELTVTLKIIRETFDAYESLKGIKNPFK